jgi:transcription initiation factor TFIID subunit 6
MPSILTCLIARRLGDPTKDIAKNTYALRDFAASVLSLVLDRYAATYSTLKPRITRAFLKAFLDNQKPFTTHYGAISGLQVLGREVVRALVLPNLKIYSEILLKPVLTDMHTDASQKYDAEKVLAAILVCAWMHC